MRCHAPHPDPSFGLPGRDHNKWPRRAETGGRAPPKQVAYSCRNMQLPMGAKVRVKVTDDSSFLWEWSAPGTFLDGSGKTSGEFRLTTSELSIRAVPLPLQMVEIPGGNATVLQAEIQGPGKDMGWIENMAGVGDVAHVPRGCTLYMKFPQDDASTSTQICEYLGWKIGDIMTEYSDSISLNPIRV